MRNPFEILTGSSIYRTKLGSKEWKAFASNIRSTRGNCCQVCRRSGIELHVHHFHYDPDKQPWDADPADVAVLCKGCHSELHDCLRQFRRHVFKYLKPSEFKVLNGALLVGLAENNALEFVHAISEMAASPASVKRFAYAWKK